MRASTVVVVVGCAAFWSAANARPLDPKLRGGARQLLKIVESAQQVGLRASQFRYAFMRRPPSPRWILARAGQGGRFKGGKVACASIQKSETREKFQNGCPARGSMLAIWTRRHTWRRRQ
jgi:hypothetical protein